MQREKKGLLKLLSNKKKLRSSPPSSPTLETEQAVAMDAPQGAAGSDMAASVANGARSGSGLVESEPSLLASGSSESSHRKSLTQEGPVPIAPPPRQPCSSLHAQHDSRPIVCERCDVAAVALQSHRSRARFQGAICVSNFVANGQLLCNQQSCELVGTYGL